MRWISALAPTSMPRVGWSRMMIRGVGISHLASSTFCWLPPDSVPVTCSMPVATTRTRLAKSVGDLRLLALRSTSPSMPHKLAQHRQRRVGADRELQHQPLLVPVLRQERNAEPHRLARRARTLTARPSIRISPRSGRVMPNSISATSERPAPTRPKKPRISPARTSKLTSSTKTAPDRPRTLEHRRRRSSASSLGKKAAGLGADHVAHGLSRA